MYLILIVLMSAMIGALIAVFICVTCGGGDLNIWRCRRRQTSTPLTNPEMLEDAPNNEDASKDVTFDDVNLSYDIPNGYREDGTFS